MFILWEEFLQQKDTPSPSRPKTELLISPGKTHEWPSSLKRSYHSEMHRVPLWGLVAVFKKEGKY